jgi:putative transposase
MKKPRLGEKNKSEKPSATRTKKIRVYPTLRQRQVLGQWFGAARWTYNQCLHGIEVDGLAKQKKALRDYCLNDAPHMQQQKVPWILKTPYDIRNEAMCDILKAYKTSFALLKAKHTTHFHLKNRTLKDASTSIVIHSKHWKDTSKIFYAAAFKKAGAEESLRTSEPLPETILYDCRLQRTRLGHYYFCLLLPGQASDNQARVPLLVETAPLIIAIDPGVRTFATGYEPGTGRYMEWGKGDMKRIERLCKHLDNLMSRTTKEPSQRRRYKMRKAQMRMRNKIRNLVDEFHKKFVKLLVDTYDLVLLPTYESSDMVNKSIRKISRPSVRAMLTWAPYRFKQRLLMKSHNTQCNVVIVDEHHTTMTCGECGHANRNVGGAKVFKCPTCLSTFPRDWNAARNIFLRFVSTSAWVAALPQV